MSPQGAEPHLSLRALRSPNVGTTAPRQDLIAGWATGGDGRAHSVMDNGGDCRACIRQGADAYPRSALGGNMIGSRMKKLAIVAGAGAVATASTLALNPFSASAADTTTTTTVTASAQATSGQPVRFTAKVSPSKTTGHPVTKPPGTVTFKIMGSDSSTVDLFRREHSGFQATGRLCKVALAYSRPPLRRTR